MVRVKGTKGRWGWCSKGVSYKKEGRMDEEGKGRKDGEPEMLLIELRLRFLAALIVLH